MKGVKCGEAEERRRQRRGQRTVFLTTSFYLHSVVYLRTNMAAEFLMNEEKRLENNSRCLFLKRSRDAAHHKE